MWANNDKIIIALSNKPLKTIADFDSSTSQSKNQQFYNPMRQNELPIKLNFRFYASIFNGQIFLNIPFFYN